MTERRQFPIQDGQHARFGRMEDHVIEAIVAMYDAGFVAGRNILRQPFDQGVHRRDFFSFRRLVLLGPAIDLAAEIIARLAETCEADFFVINQMQLGDDAIHFVVVGAALGGCHARHCLVP